jgi:hypothetical protein
VSVGSHQIRVCNGLTPAPLDTSMSLIALFRCRRGPRWSHPRIREASCHRGVTLTTPGQSSTPPAPYGPHSLIASQPGRAEGSQSGARRAGSQGRSSRGPSEGRDATPRQPGQVKVRQRTVGGARRDAPAARAGQSQAEDRRRGATRRSSRQSGQVEVQVEGRDAPGPRRAEARYQVRPPLMGYPDGSPVRGHRGLAAPSHDVPTGSPLYRPARRRRTG